MSNFNKWAVKIRPFFTMGIYDGYHNSDSDIKPTPADFHSAVGRNLGSNYQDLFSANPYMDYHYSTTLWDKVGNFFGFRTAEDKYKDEMYLKSKEYDSQLMQMQMENQYNSEYEKAMRMRQAGINPDLQGISSASQSSEFNQEMTSPTVPESSAGMLQQLFQNVIVNGFDLFSRYNQIKGQILDNDNKELGIVGNAESIGNDLAIPMLSYDYEGDPRFNSGHISNPALRGYSKRNQARILQSLSRARDSYSTLARFYGFANQGSFDRTEWIQRKKSKLGADMLGSESALSDTLDAYVECMDMAAAYNSDANSYKAQNASAYERRNASNRNAEKLSDAESAEFTERKSMSKYRTEIMKPLRDLVHKLSAKDDPFSKTMAFSVLIALNQFMPNFIK